MEDQDKVDNNKTTGKESDTKGKAIARELRDWIIYLMIVIGICYVITHFIGQRTEVFGSSMEPTLHNGDNLITDKISYRLRDPKRYDIIVFPFDKEKDVNYIKRVIGLPGETIQVIEGHVYVDGKQLNEDYGNEIMDNSGIAAEPITLSDDEYFVLGDNRNNSADSRQENVGTITREEIIGRAWVRVYPFKQFGVIAHE